MAFNVFGAKESFPQEEIVKTAEDEGIRDDEGNVFEIITLISLRQVANNTSTHGFTDTFFDARGKGTIEVYQGPKGRGRIKWMVSRGRAYGQLQKIPENVMTLAKGYYDGLWKIKDEIQDSEIKALADNFRSTMSEEGRKKEDERIRTMNQSGYGGSLVNREGRTPREIQLELENAELRKQQLGVKKREVELLKEKKEIISKTIKKIESNGMAIEYTRESLEAVKGVFQLRKISRVEFGIEIDQKMTKPQIIEAILGEQAKRSSGPVEDKKEPITITG
jgi:hypothetical protein